MIKKSRWLVPTALTIVMCLLADATRLMVFVAGAALALAATFYTVWHDFKPRSKYDLGLLQEVQDREELRSLDDNVGVMQYEDTLCPYCRTHYSTEYARCPKCGRIGPS